MTTTTPLDAFMSSLLRRRRSSGRNSNMLVVCDDAKILAPSSSCSFRRLHKRAKSSRWDNSSSSTHSSMTPPAAPEDLRVCNPIFSPELGEFRKKLAPSSVSSTDKLSPSTPSSCRWEQFTNDRKPSGARLPTIPRQDLKSSNIDALKKIPRDSSLQKPGRQTNMLDLYEVILSDLESDDDIVSSSESNSNASWSSSDTLSEAFLKDEQALKTPTRTSPTNCPFSVLKSPPHRLNRVARGA